MSKWTDVDQAGLEEKFASWVEMIATMHHGANNRVNEVASFAPMTGSLAEATVALVSTAGVHLADQEPFDVSTTDGDPSFRVIPHDVDVGDLRFTHTHYDTSSAEIDPNVVFPIERLRELIADGRIGSASDFHVGLMGFNPDPTRIADETAPEVATMLAEAAVDVVLLIPG